MQNLDVLALPQGRQRRHMPAGDPDLSRRIPTQILSFAFLLFFCQLLMVPSSAVADGLAPSLEELKTPPADAQRLASGLVTKVIVPGTGEEHPDSNDLVAVHFIGWTPTGQEFRNSYTADKHGVFNLQEVFPGWSEGIQKMVVGEKRRLWIPSHLGPQNPRSGPPGASIFDVELLGIKPVPNAPARVDRPIDGAEATGSGAYTKLLEAGSGEVQPDFDSVALLEYHVWTSDGEIFDSTLSRGRPTAFPLDKILPAFADAIQLMVEGEKRYIWIPGSLAEGQWPGNPQGALTFEVRLVRILPAEVLKHDTEGLPTEGLSNQGPSSQG